MATYYVGLAGSDLNPGTINSPWSLSWSMNSANTVLQPGDTVRLLPGVYQFPSTSSPFLATKAGTSSEPIIYRPHILTERTALGGAIRLNGANIRLVALEHVFDSQETRDGAPDQTLLQRWNAGIDPQAGNIQYIEANIHDQLQGAFAGNLAPGFQMHDCLIWNNGVDGPVRGHGHSLYIQGQQAQDPKLFRNILSWGGYRYGMQYYGTEDSRVFNISTIDSSFFMMGVASQRTGEANAGHAWQQWPGEGGNILYRRCNLFRQGVATDARSMRIGSSQIWNASGITMEDSILRGSIELQQNYGTTFRRNLVWVEDQGSQQAVWDPITREMPPGTPTSVHSIDNNEYYKRTTGIPFNLTNWRNATGWDLNSTAFNANPSGVRCNAVPTKYGIRSLGHLHIWNFSGASSVTVGIGPALRFLTGMPYAIYHVFDFVTNGPPLVTGIYDGSRVTIPMAARTPPRPYGALVDPPQMPNTFGGFVVTVNPGYALRYRGGIG
jgi:hypothetical protein